MKSSPHVAQGAIFEHGLVWLDHVGLRAHLGQICDCHEPSII